MIINKKNTITGLILLTLLFIPFLVLFNYVHPIADDLAFVHQSQNTSIINIFKNVYSNWNGRYSGNIFVLLFPISLDNLLLYRGALIGHFLLFVLALNFFVKSVLYSVSKSKTWVVSLLGVLTYLSIAPSLSESFYWYTSAVYYQFSLILFLTLFALTINHTNQKYIVNQYFHKTVSIGLLFVLIGINESMAIITPLIFLGFVVYGHLIKTNNKWYLTLLFLIAFVLACVVVFSPGNENRISTYVNNKNIVHSLFMTILQMVRFFSSFIFSAAGLFYLLFVACFFSHKSTFVSKLNPFYLFIGFIVILFLCIFPAYYATGILGQHRTLNIAAMFYLLFLTFLGLKIGKKLEEKLPRKPIKMIFYFVLFYFVFGNGKTVFLDLYSGKINDYSEQLQKRAAIVKSKKSANIFPLTVTPKSIYVIDVAKDSTNWVNQAYLLPYKE